MDVKITESDKNQVKIEFSEKDEGFLNLIKAALWEQSETEMAGYRIEHPIVGKPVFFLKVKEGKDAKKVWNSALDSVSEQLDSFGKGIKQLK